MKINSSQIGNRVAVLSKFDRSIKFNLVRYGKGRFGFVSHQTGRKMFLEWPSRLDAAVGMAARYFTCQSYRDCAFVNPKSVAVVSGIDMALDLLISAGFVRIEHAGKTRRAVIAENYDISKNQ